MGGPSVHQNQQNCTCCRDTIRNHPRRCRNLIASDTAPSCLLHDPASHYSILSLTGEDLEHAALVLHLDDMLVLSLKWQGVGKGTGLLKPRSYCCKAERFSKPPPYLIRLDHWTTRSSDSDGTTVQQ